jgi:hypothetical protein
MPPDETLDLVPPDEDDPLQNLSIPISSVLQVRNLVYSNAIGCPLEHFNPGPHQLDACATSLFNRVAQAEGDVQTNFLAPTDALDLTPTTTSPQVVGSPTQVNNAKQPKGACTPSTTSMAPSESKHFFVVAVNLRSIHQHGLFVRM